MLVRLLVATLLLPAIAFASPEDEETTSYRSQTLTADAVGLSLLLAGALAEDDDGRDTSASGALFGAGAISTLLATPLIHAAHGHGDRAIGSFFMRGGLVVVGGLAAVAANSGCGDGEPAGDGAFFDDDFLCELDYVGYGILAGVIAASVIDAAFMTDEPVERATWAPQLSATSEGVRAGAVFAW